MAEMTPQEKRIRAREACAATIPMVAKAYRRGDYDDAIMPRAIIRALNDLDKPIPDADEAWRPFLVAIDLSPASPFDNDDRANIVLFKAARHLMPPEES